MFSHIMLGSNNIEESKRFYDAVLGTLGAGEPFRNQGPSGHIRYFYRHDGSTFCISEPIDGEEATCANGATIGFKCHSPEQVKAFHDTAVAQGGVSIEDPPGLRESPMGAMHLAYPITGPNESAPRPGLSHCTRQRRPDRALRRWHGGMRASAFPHTKFR